MWDLVGQFIGMEKARMESKYHQELTSINLKLVIIQKLET